MKILITGASGFVASHLIVELKKHDHELALTCMTEPRDTFGFKFYSSDITDEKSVVDLVARVRPDAVIHLAGISHVVSAAQHQIALVNVNVVGTHHLCAAMSRLDKKVRFLFASTSLVYGDSKNGDVTVTEHSPVAPVNAYGFSKLAAESIVNLYRSDQFKPYIVRPFNHIGPGQHPSFVCPSLAKRIIDAPDGGEIVVGNLSAYRDFSDVRDVVRAYRLILEQEPTESLFVIGSGVAVQIQSVLDRFIKISGKKIRTKVSADLLRANDPQKVVADTQLMRERLKWSCNIPLDQTLNEIYQSLS